MSTEKKKILSDLMICAKNILLEAISEMKEVDIEEVFNMDNEAPFVH